MELRWNLPGLTESDQQLVARLVEVTQMDAGQAVIREGDRPQALFAIAEGTVRVEAHRGGALRELAQLGPGAVLGEISFATNDPATATVLTLGPCRVARLSTASVEAASLEHPGFAERLYRGIAQLVHERLRADVGRLYGDEAPQTLPTWSDSLAGLRAIVLPPVVQSYIDRYEKLGHRNAFLWRWCWRAVEEVSLASVPERWRLHTLSTKLVAIVLNVLLDDLADRPGGGPRFEEAVARLMHPDSPFLRASEDSLSPEERYLRLVVDLWQSVEGSARVLPNWERYRALWYFDYQQIFTAMRYSMLTRSFPGLDNLTENRAVIPHNANMMIFANIDLMASEVADDDLGLVRQAVLHGQSIAQIGNMVATWRREVPDRDFGSRIFALALDLGVLTRSELRELDPAQLVERIEAAQVEEHLLRELRDHRRAVAETVRKVRSFDMRGFEQGVDQVLAMSLSARGFI
jgi:hypothetical protein